MDTADAAELAELLQFLADWLAADQTHLDTSLARFVGNRLLTGALDEDDGVIGGEDAFVA